MRARLAWILAVTAACGSEAEPDATHGRDLAEATALVARIGEEGVLDRLVALGEVEPVLAATAADRPARTRHLACLALGRIGGAAARDRLLELLVENSRIATTDGPLHLYVAVGLTLLCDAGTAVDLVATLSTVNPDDYLAALASEERDDEYYTIDAQLCEALLAMGLWQAEEELVQQLRRRDRIRVLIDASAVLRRQTGLDLPFRYNGSYEDRLADADRWEARLRETRAERIANRPFDASNEGFRRRCREVVDWLGGQSVNYRQLAHKILLRIGRHAVPFLETDLASANPVAQRQAAHMLGRIGARESAPLLRDALNLEDADARAEAIQALRLIGDREARVQMDVLLEDRDPEVRAAAASFLGACGGAEDVARLREVLATESSPGTAAAILCALLGLGDASAAPALVRVFVEGEQLERQAALEALETFLGRSTGVSALARPEERANAGLTMTGWLQER